MFILKRQDVEISSVQHPKKDQQIPILTYQGQSFRLISVFNASQEEEAKAFWRDLTDNQGKACVLLEEPERYSVWGKIRLEQLAGEMDGPAAGAAVSPIYVKACMLMLQAVYIDIEDLLGGRQASLFQKDIADVFKQWHFPQTESSDAVKYLLTVDPLNAAQIPPWQEHHLNTLLQELHRIGKAYFGNTTFVERAIDALQDLPGNDRGLFQRWLNQSPLGKLWH
ncbi:MAG: Npun_F0813 family protein [Kovacikia sp.]